MKRIATIIICLAVSVMASAQYKVSSVERTHGPEFELRYVLETENSTFIYGTMTSSAPYNFFFGKEMAVLQNGLRYKLLNSVNIPGYDEAEQRTVIFADAGEKVNFLLEFEKFPLAGSFDIVEKESASADSPFLNMYGIQLESADPAEFPDPDRFLDTYPVTIGGHYVEDGSNVAYIMREDVFVSCRCTNVDDGFLEPKYKRFLVEINNDSDHGIMFDFDKTYVMGIRKVHDKVQEKRFVKYSPDSFEGHIASLDYQEARYNVGGMKDVGQTLERESWNSRNGEWANIGLKVLGVVANEIAERNIRDYLATHPKQRPGVLRSQSLAPGSSIVGYMAFKTQKADKFVLHIPMDGYDFHFDWK